MRSRNTTAILLGSLGAALLPSLEANARELSSDLEFSATIYGWLPDIAGDTTFPAGASSIEVDIKTILDHLKMTAMGTFRVQKDRWGGFTDVVYLDVGDTRTNTRNLSIGGQPLPASVTATTEFDLKTLFLTLGANYTVVATTGATFDVLAGARFADMKQTLDWEFTGSFGPITPPPITGRGQAAADVWDFIVGFRGEFALGAGKKWVVPYYFDVGTGDSDVTLQAMVGLGYAFGWGNLSLAWRHLDYDFGDDGRITDLAISGPAVGATFRW
jgi:hypothetical protein